MRTAPVSMAMRLGWCSTAGTMVWPCTTLKPKSAVEVRNGSRIQIRSSRVCSRERHAGPDAGVDEEVAAEADLSAQASRKARCSGGKAAAKASRVAAGPGAGVRNAVGGERGVAAHVVGEPVVGAVVPVRIAQVGRDVAVVVAEQEARRQRRRP